MTPTESREFTKRLEQAAIFLLNIEAYRKPDDLARRFGLPIPVVRYWWRKTDGNTHPISQNQLSAKDIKNIRKATQTLDGWEKIKRYRPPCGAKLSSGTRCKRSVAIRQPEGWSMGALADRCRLHGGLSKNFKVKKEPSEE